MHLLALLMTSSYRFVLERAVNDTLKRQVPLRELEAELEACYLV